MPVPLRRYYGQQLVKAKKRESDAYNKINKESSSDIQRPSFRKS